MANLKIDDQDIVAAIIALQTDAGISPVSLRIDDSDIERAIITLQAAAGISPVNLKIDRSDFVAKIIQLQNTGFGGGGAFSPSLDFSDSRNSQYISVVGL